MTAEPAEEVNIIEIHLTPEEMDQFVGLAQMAEDAGVHVDNDVMRDALISGIENRIGMPVKAAASIMGKSRSEKKTAAARENGKKGGRPWKERISLDGKEGDIELTGLDH